MDMTNEQIEQEFRRQVRLCRGIGLDSMLAIVCDEMDSVPVMTPKDIDDVLAKHGGPYQKPPRRKLRWR